LAPPINHETIEAAVRAAGAEAIVERLPNGYDRLLGKWFDDGIELSGGEWQRLALARAFLKNAPILLLNEPTSAMDSWAEVGWFDRFRQAAAGRTTIIITHRFTTAMQADVIHVMNDGHIVESGSHRQLLAIGGRYSRSWAQQTGEPASKLVSLSR
jgi:ATP-binding cassette, subfamily B, bacterial